MNSKCDISIVIPVFNAAQYIEKTLDSVISQTFEGSMELILINDGSSDNSCEVMERYLENVNKDNFNYRIINDGENRGQGSRRNLGIELAQGESILFLDADDFLVPDALKVAYEKLTSSKQTSFVIFEWAFYYPETGDVKYINKEKYNKYDELLKDECELLLATNNYFTVNKLYRKSFLDEHNIRYGEGYLYEDFEFYVKCAIKAVNIPVVPNILYKVRVHENSSTKLNSNSLKHRDSFLIAVASSLDAMQKMGYKSEFSPYHTIKYFLLRSLIYSEKRLPNNKKIKKDFLKQTMRLFNKYFPSVITPNSIVSLYRMAFKDGLIKNEDVNGLVKAYNLQKKGKLNYYVARKIETKKLLKKVKNKIEGNYFLNPLVVGTRRKVHAYRRKKKVKQQNYFMNLPINNNKILMLGFDYRYSGNSKYLFDFLKHKYSNAELKFVTADQSVPPEYRVVPRSAQFFHELYTSKVIIAESWIPLAFKKKEQQKWIQLWHGTPFKKMLFDSAERRMLQLNSNHKVNKKKDISKWDYLLADSDIAVSKFNSAFDIEKSKIMNFGYPRNQWLVENKDNESLIAKIKKENNIPMDKKVLLYAPTWRDYNYRMKSDNQDMSYLMNISELLEFLGDEYVVINKGHALDTNIENDLEENNIIQVNNQVDIQKLILCSDAIITDYSSIFFDAIHIDKPFYFLMKDFEKFDEIRGVYPDIYKAIESLVYTDELLLSQAVKNEKYNQFTLPENFINSTSDLANESIYETIEQAKKQ
ncbi:hypothetical protein BU035_13275 [Staphylococcus simulans]|uniref:bifunctional glycosyltransferase/CDP-glycerol:glycerophosphate glycerophosphotransferase n=1 Tax=Staphylococcus simulans TaxID=1286 RepID=UPI000D1D9E86|nr:CDP-glycerol glycerophosphotransferase family protein [Staphylococcus simulans]PTJ22085.1 hypothetical protein BU035_13275 [Staphylococcus simulans]